MSKTITLGCLGTPSGKYCANVLEEKIKPSGSRTETTLYADSKSMFIALEEGDIDLVAVDATTLAAELPEELELIAVTERQRVNDVVISNRPDATLTTDTKNVVATSVLRAAFVRHYFPETPCTLAESPEAIEQALKSGADLAVTSYYEALWMNLENRITEVLETSYFTPAAGQGCIAVLCHRKMEFAKKDVVRWWANHEETEDCLRTERSFSQALPLTEKRPVFSYAHFEGALVTLKAGIITADGRNLYKTKKSSILAETRDLGKKAEVDIARLLVEQHAQSV